MPSQARAEKRRQFERLRGCYIVWYARGMQFLVLTLVLALLLGACTAQQAAIINMGVEKVKAVNDTTAKVLIQSTCGMTYGAWDRLESPTDKRGVDLLCGGDGEDPITLQDLRRFLDAR